MSKDERNAVWDRVFLRPQKSSATTVAVYESPVLEVPGGFLRAAPSWNLSLAAGADFRVELRVSSGGAWSPYVAVGDQTGGASESSGGAAAGFGAMDVDEFVAAGEPLRRLQLRVETEEADSVSRLAVALDRAWSAEPPADGEVSLTRIDVPFRSQFEGTDVLGPRVCSPTCVAMVLVHYGHALSTKQVAEACYDRRHDIYGNWARAVQVAFAQGVPGAVRRFGGWPDVGGLIERGRPVIASVRYGPGGLPGAAVGQTRGHLVVVTGFAEGGRVCVNDPAFRCADDGVRTYPGEALARAWFGGSGIGYVLGE
ncbi:MAG: C39 family peptidase [Phycisphaerales bacterium]|nr:MAG: C39 family peptidase [Phycisphaerales bacterium]